MYILNFDTRQQLQTLDYIIVRQEDDKITFILTLKNGLFRMEAHIKVQVNVVV